MDIARKIGIITSGGDCPGMNCAIRAAVRTAVYDGMEVVGFYKGYRGILDKDYTKLDSFSVAGIMQRGGTMLQTARCLEMMHEEYQKVAADNIRSLGIDAMLVIGGEGSLKGALALERQGIKCVGLPASIDNDLAFTDMAMGVDTALNTILWATDSIKDTATSHDRAFVIEVMGRNCGYLAVVAGIAAGAEYAIIPESPIDLDSVAMFLKGRFDEGRTNAMIIVAEGAASGADVAAKLKDKIGFEVRVSVLGHIQRGGQPTAFDRLLASRMGRSAVHHIIDGKHNIMIGLSKGEMTPVSLEDVASTKKTLDRDFLSLALTLGT